MNNEYKLEDEQLDAAYVIIAEIVTKYGEKYLPIFTRIHEEMEARKARKNLMSVAASIVR